MSYDIQHPPAYNGMEKDISISQGGYVVKERQHGKNPCMQILRSIRSKFYVMIYRDK